MSNKIIYGDTVGTPMSRSDWAEENERSAAYIKNKPTEEIAKNTEARHTHDNQDVLDRITADLFGSFRTIVENTTINFSGFLRSDKYYIFVNPAKKIAITSLLHVGSVDVVPEYIFEFTSGDIPTRLSLPRDYVWANNDVPVIKSNKKYIIRIVGSISTYSEVSI